MLVTDEVNKRFGGLNALSGITFNVEQGGLVAIIGPNGAGKSTLINVISGDTAPTAGTIRIDGKDITALPAYLVNRTGIARTFQHGELYKNLSVLENVVAAMATRHAVSMLGSIFRPARTKALGDRLSAEALRILRKVGLDGHADTKAAVLPAGQQRLLGVARALASGAKWLLLDEPAAGLNPAEKNALVNVIRSIWQEGTTILFVEHDMRVVGDLAQRVIVLDQGKIIADGSPSEIRSSKSVLRAYLGSDELAGKQASQADGRDLGSARELLQIDALELRYGGLIALRDVSLNVRCGEIVSVLGANGAGKTSLLKAVTRTLPAYAGRIAMDGIDITELKASDVIHAGIALVPEGRELFNSLSVVDNLRLGAYSRVKRLRQYIPDFFRSRGADVEIEATLEEVFGLFPKLKERTKQLAGTLSGGEGQMLAIGRALMSRPRLLLLDEPSLGLAPKVIMDIFAKLLELRNQGLTIMLVEQNAHAALELSDRAYVLSTGRMAAEGPSRILSKSAEIRKSYLGIGDQI